MGNIDIDKEYLAESKKSAQGELVSSFVDSLENGIKNQWCTNSDISFAKFYMPTKPPLWVRIKDRLSGKKPRKMAKIELHKHF